ncbi:MAG: nicotinamide mononucleotide transporter family protein, partial [Myxococcota bacterium]|nr:nicotinamide mononucleotide transporter family protein [Myxococcota bacterium]
VVFMPKSAWVPMLLLLIAGSVLMGWLLSRYTPAALPFWDGGSRWVAFVAMWMSARKWIENWILWLAVDVVKTGVYVSQGIELYAVLYGVYIVMAFWGWASWKKAMSEERS